MINLQPIHSKIRAELHRRQKLLNREGIKIDDEHENQNTVKQLTPNSASSNLQPVQNSTSYLVDQPNQKTEGS